MRKILSERNLVVFLFFVALVVFSFAQEDAKKVEKMYLDTHPAAPSILPTPRQTAGALDLENHKPVKMPGDKK